MGNQTSSTGDQGDVEHDVPVELPAESPGKAAPDGDLQVDFPNSDDEDNDDASDLQSCVTQNTGISGSSFVSANSRVRRSVLLVNRRLLDTLNQDTPVVQRGNKRTNLAKDLSYRIMSRADSVRSGLTATSHSIPPAPNFDATENNASQLDDNSDSISPSNAVKGLPGFLRRSIRGTYDDDNNSSDTNTAPAASATNQNKSIPETNNVASLSSTASFTPDDNNSSMNNTDRSASLGASSVSSKSMSKQAQRSVSDSSNVLYNSYDTKAPGKFSKPALDKAKSYKVTAFERCISAPIVDLRELQKLGWNGVPAEYRADTWKMLLGYLPANSSRRSHTLERKRQEYRDAIAQHYDIDDQTRTTQEQETLRQVLVDVPRTAPDVGLFRSNRIRRILARLLYIWAMRHPASSYVQGINDLVTPLIAVFLSGYYQGRSMTDGNLIEEVEDGTLFEVEADSYWCLTKLLSGIQDHYTCDQPGVQRMVFRLEELVCRIDVGLSEHLKSKGIEFIQFSFKWMNCLLLREFSLQCVMRLWDTYLSEGDGGFEDFHVYVCAAFLCQFSSEVQQMDFDDLFGFMQNMPTGEWGDAEVEVLLSQAFVLSTLFGGSDAHLTSGNRT